MLDFLKSMKKDKFDAFFFMPGPEEDTVKVEGAAYRTPGEPVEYSDIGNMYHIILFKEDTEGNIVDPDMFEAILIEPLEYVSRMITCEFYGLVAKKTTTSSEFIQSTFDKLKDV